MCLKLFLRKEQLIKPATLFSGDVLINIKTRHFGSSNKHQEHLFDRTLITSYFLRANITKFLRAAFSKKPPEAVV